MVKQWARPTFDLKVDDRNPGLWGRERGKKESLQRCPRNLNFCIETLKQKADWSRFNLVMISFFALH